MARKVQTIKPVKAWAGLSDGKLHRWGGEVPYYEIYSSRKIARMHYEAVVPVMVTPIKPKSVRRK